MAGVSTPEMAAAVSNAGGLGSVAAGALSVEVAEKQFSLATSSTNGAVALNLFVHKRPTRDPAQESAWLERLQPQFDAVGAKAPATLNEIYKSFHDNDAMLEMLQRCKPRVVSFHFGLPDPAKIEALKGVGAVLMATATNPEEARAAEEAGIDMIVAQGYEAGGHRGVFDDKSEDTRLGTMALVPKIVSAVNLPVVAAGGITDGAGIAAAFALGAQGVQLGTAFVACPESLASASYRRLLTSGDEVRTEMTRGVSGRPARALVNDLIEAVRAPDHLVPDYPVTYDAAKQLAEAAKKFGARDMSVMWAGQGAGQVRALPAGELVETLWAETLHEVAKLRISFE